MRSVATLIVLILIAAIVVAQEAVEPTPPTVYPLCKMAFARASEALLSGPTASPTEPTASDAPQVGPSPSASPRSFADFTALEDTVRMCSSVEEFTAASALYPDVLGDTDPMDFLAAQCRSDATDLAMYATCSSLERALATPTPAPTPTPTATPTPTPSPAPTATPRPPKQDIERVLAKAIKGGTWEPYRKSPASAAFDPFESGARTGVIFDDLERELHRSIDYVVLFHFDDADDLASYWQRRAAAAASAAPQRDRPCVDGRPGRDVWAQGQYLCYVSDEGNALMRWTNDQSGTYGVMNAVGGSRDLRNLYLEWLPVALGTANATEVKATPRPTPRPTPKPTPRPTPRSDWNQKTYDVAVRYLKSARRTYAVRLPSYIDDLRYYDWTAPWLTKGERNAIRAEGDILRDRALAVLQNHRRFMSRNTPAKCFHDAYAADRRISERWIEQLRTGRYGSPDTPTGRAINYKYDVLDRATDNFTYRLAHRYFNDCR